MILKNVVDISEKILILHEKISKIKNDDENKKSKDDSTQNTNNENIKASLVDIINEM